ncbi:mediator of RNA polymerase ii transcription subunit 9 [Biomphalaria glabrata]|uniref:Mediator of RNA polymerase II transcription subunit 9 n=2 Tax=Biomphalaria TaxID=6525 RepID=A0A9W2ZJK2_BIOGL|nr:mediator of RNA polymerase II transcription subunit 9-like [Biomphalaria glabrata]KAI8766534.1 mediator of RNA polymerase II transcription subunit 9-like [Biomphalaria glabrata]KAK0049256.1 mediator of RNA polymerase II transcription subunit 9 [Biomphalaria pfeifferi]
MAASAAADNELNILPYVYEVIKSIEKDTNDVTVGQKMTELKSQFQKARECIDKLPGTQHSQEEQLRVKSILHQQLLTKTKLLADYKTGNSFPLSVKNNIDISGGNLS